VVPVLYSHLMKKTKRTKNQYYKETKKKKKKKSSGEQPIKKYCFSLLYPLSRVLDVRYVWQNMKALRRIENPEYTTIQPQK
jgi:hypothetical protein